MPTRLTDEDVRNVRILAAQGVDPARIARDFDFDPEALYDAVEGVTFRYITAPPPVRCKTLEITPLRCARIVGLKLDVRRLRKIRVERLGLSQSQFATALREAGLALNVPNRCTKRLVQKWECGEHEMPSPSYQLALTHVIGPGVEAIYQQVLPATVDDTMEQLAAVLPAFAATYDRLIELNAHLVQSVAEADPAYAKRPRISANTFLAPQVGLLS